MKIWLNGAFLETADARIDPADRGLLLGDGVFETVRTSFGHSWHLDRHLARLRHGAATLGLAVSASDAEIRQAARVVAAHLADGARRITLTRGPAPRGVLPPAVPTPTLLIAAAALPPTGAPLHAIIATCTRRNEHSPLAGIKSLNYLDSILARREAAAHGAGEAILLNTAGRIAEATAGNFFACIGKDWVTPPVAGGALPGIARGLILEAGLAREASIDPGDLAAASGAFISSSLALRPIMRIGAHDWRMHDLTSLAEATRG